MNFCTAMKILIFNCSEQEAEPNEMILREIVSARLESVVKKYGLIKLFNGQME